MKLRFSIRDLLLVALVAALAIGWLIDHRRLAPLQEKVKVAEDTAISTN